MKKGLEFNFGKVDLKGGIKVLSSTLAKLILTVGKKKEHAGVFLTEPVRIPFLNIQTKSHNIFQKEKKIESRGNPLVYFSKSDLRGI